MSSCERPKILGFAKNELDLTSVVIHRTTEHKEHKCMIAVTCDE